MMSLKEKDQEKFPAGVLGRDRALVRAVRAVTTEKAILSLRACPVCNPQEIKLQRKCKLHLFPRAFSFQEWKKFYPSQKKKEALYGLPKFLDSSPEH